MTSDLLIALKPIISRARTDISAIKNNNGVSWKRDEPLTKDRLKEHLNGGTARGVCPIKEGEATTRLGLLDLDSHKGETPWESMAQIAQTVAAELERRGMKPIPFRSSGGKGIHLFLLWDTPQDAYSVRQFLREAIGALGYENGAGGVAKKQIEIFPKQDKVLAGDCGSQFILPLAGKSVPLDSANNLHPMAREAVTTLAWPVSASVPVAERPAPPQRSARPALEDEDLEHFREQLTYIDPDVERNVWLKIGMMLHYETGGSQDGLIIWDEWSAGDLWKNGSEGAPGSYQGFSDLEYQWERFRSDRPNPVTRGTLEKYAREAGWGRVSAENEFGYINMSAQATERFQMVNADDYANGPEPEWIIDGVLPAEGIAMIVGASATLAKDILARQYAG